MSLGLRTWVVLKQEHQVTRRTQATRDRFGSSTVDAKVPPSREGEEVSNIHHLRGWASGLTGTQTLHGTAIGLPPH